MVQMPTQPYDSTKSVDSGPHTLPNWADFAPLRHLEDIAGGWRMSAVEIPLPRGRVTVILVAFRDLRRQVEVWTRDAD
jgi:hypothetical protein